MLILFVGFVLVGCVRKWDGILVHFPREVSVVEEDDNVVDSITGDIAVIC